MIVDLANDYSPVSSGGTLSQKVEAIRKVKERLNSVEVTPEIARAIFGDKFIGNNHYVSLFPGYLSRNQVNIEFSLTELLSARARGYYLILRQSAVVSGRLDMRVIVPRMKTTSISELSSELLSFDLIDPASRRNNENKGYFYVSCKADYVLARMEPLAETLGKDMLDQIEIAVAELFKVVSMSETNKYEEDIAEFEAKKPEIRELLDQRRTREAAIAINNLAITRIILKSPSEYFLDYALLRENEMLGAVSSWSPTRQVMRSDGQFVDIGGDTGSGLKIGKLNPGKRFENTGLVMQISPSGDFVDKLLSL